MIEVVVLEVQAVVVEVTWVRSQPWKPWLRYGYGAIGCGNTRSGSGPVQSFRQSSVSFRMVSGSSHGTPGSPSRRRHSSGVRSRVPPKNVGMEEAGQILKTSSLTPPERTCTLLRVSAGRKIDTIFHSTLAATPAFSRKMSPPSSG